MKKILLLLSIITCYFSTYAQTFTVTPSSVTSGTVVTVKASGESLSSNIYNLGGNYISLSVASPNQGYASDVNGSIVQGTVTYYNTGTNAPTTFQFKPTSSAPVPVTVTYTIVTYIQNLQQGGSTPQMVNKQFTITINPPTAPTTYYNVAKSKVFYNNTCAAGYASDPYTYTVPANKYSGSTQTEADNKALNDINTNGQNVANAKVECKLVFYNTALSQSFVPACAVGYGYNGPAIPYDVPAGKYKSLVSQDDANSQAQAEINANGQNTANTHCTLNPIYAKLTKTHIQDAPRYRYCDIVVSFYADAAGTQPVSVSNLQVIIQTLDYGNPQTSTSLIANGTSVTKTGYVLIAKNTKGDITDEYTYQLSPSSAYNIIP